MKVTHLLLIILSLITLINSRLISFSQDKCCVSCAGKEKKFYSIDTWHNQCGECCMDPWYYWLYKIFEIGLHQAETDTPCADYGYHEYLETETHGALGITMTLDMYLPDKSENKNEMLKFLEEAAAKNTNTK